MILKRDGGYLCGCSTLEHGRLVVHRYPQEPVPPSEAGRAIDAEIIGQVTAILRRLP
jgi:hypothetical protein